VNVTPDAVVWEPSITMTLAAPAVCDGVVAVMDVGLTTVTADAAVPPTVTVAPLAKPVPVIVIGVPPAVMPLAGLIALADSDPA
jgi:hypothetical protein